MSNIAVIKRDGTKESLNLEKLHKMTFKSGRKKTNKKNYTPAKS